MDGENQEEEEKVQYKNLTEEKLEDIIDGFEWFDKDKDGMISTFELTNLLRQLGFNPTATEMKKLCEIHDPGETQHFNLKTTKEIVNKKVMEPDTFEELIEAMKILDTSGDGTIPVPELRWAMTQLGQEPMDEGAVDDMISEADPDKKNFVDILEFAKICFKIKDK